jgi:hypothetical protein
MTKPTKLTLLIAVLATGLASSASASTHGEKTYYDTIRPHGHPRSFALYSAGVDACYDATGESRTAVYDTAAFRQCMLARLPLPIYKSGSGPTGRGGAAVLHGPGPQRYDGRRL